MIVGTVKETFAGDRRVAIVPEVVSNYTKRGFEVLVEKGAGLGAGFQDEAYAAKGAKLAGSREEVFEKADLIAHVRMLGANPDAGVQDFSRMRKDQIVIGSADPLSRPDLVHEAAPSGANLFSMELIPRITRAQSMDILSSMATVAGYKAVLWAAEKIAQVLPHVHDRRGHRERRRRTFSSWARAWPGLQAIATAKRLGAIVSAYDVRDDGQGAGREPRRQVRRDGPRPRRGG